jgi:Secretory lipase
VRKSTKIGIKRGLASTVAVPVLTVATLGLTGSSANAQPVIHIHPAVELAAAATVPSPYNDSFYTQPNPMPSVPPGTVLNSRSVTVTALGIPTKITAWQILYASTGMTGEPVADVATVLLPAKAAATSPRPLLSYQVAEDADTMNCAPSYEMRLGIEVEEPLMAAALEQGWAVVVPDYEGLNSDFTGGPQEGHGVLDAIRAAEGFGPLGLDGASTPVGMWGYSGGALATGWAAELEPSYASALNVKGVAEGGVPADFASIVNNINGGPFAGLYFDAAFGLARSYPQDIDLATLLNPLGQQAEATVTSECVEEIVAQYAYQNIQTYTAGNIDPLSVPGVQDAIAADNLGQRTPVGPVFMYQAANDEIIPLAGVQALNNAYCSEGVPVDFVKDELSDHISLAVSGAGAALNYLIARFAGTPAPSTCATGGVTVATTLLQPASNLVITLAALAGLTGFF